MTGLIKAGAGVSVRSPFGPATLARQPIVSAALETSQPEVTNLREQIARLEDDAKVAAEAARRAGVEEGMQRATEQKAAKDKQLREALVAARTGWDERLAELEPLAALLANNALEKVFGRQIAAKESIAAAIAVQVERLGEESVVAIRISGDDFVEADLLSLGSAAHAARIDPSLKRGEALIDLQLGFLQVTPSMQWARLSAFFEDHIPLDLAA